MTILIVLHNEVEYVKLALQSIRLFADIEQLSVVVIDNHSEDAAGEWLKAQEDITYVCMDEGELPFGQAVNKVCRALQIDDDILIMNVHYMLTPHALSQLQTLLYEDDAVGAVGAVSNSFSLYQRKEDLADYNEAVRWADRGSAAVQGKWVLGLHSDIILIKACTYRQIGYFDEELNSQEYVMRDYGFRMISNDWKQVVCHNALFWDVRGNGPYYSGDRTQNAVLERKWGMHYFNTMYNANLIDLIAKDNQVCISVLEIGCDCGANLLEIRNQYPNAVVYGAEINDKAARIASHIANVQVNNIEEENLGFAAHTFDYIIFGDVLEHLRDPLRAIRYCRNLLKRDGCILASVPNLMHVSVIEDLLRGNFTYTETGLLDKTHIHFFTFNEIMRMFSTGGYDVERVNTVIFTVSPEQELLIDRLQELQKGTSRFMYETFQYVLCAKVQGD